MPQASDSAVVLFPGALGDFLCFLPTLLALRQRHGGRLLVAAKPSLLQLLRLHRTSTASIDRQEVADLFRTEGAIAPATAALFGGYASGYSWTGAAHKAFAQRLAAATGGRVSVYAFRSARSGEPASKYYARCVGLSPPRSVAQVLAEDGSWLAEFEQRLGLATRRVLVLHAGSGSSRKNWHGFAAVAEYWCRRQREAVVWLRGPAEEAMSAPGAPVFPIDGLSLPQVAALLHRSSLYLGNDSGVSHLAAAIGVPGLVLFGPTDPRVWAPQGGALRVLHVPAPCPACGRDRFCLHRLPAATVIDALEGVAAAAVRARRARPALPWLTDSR